MINYGKLITRETIEQLRCQLSRLLILPRRGILIAIAHISIGMLLTTCSNFVAQEVIEVRDKAPEVRKCYMSLPCPPDCTGKDWNECMGVEYVKPADY